MTKRRFPALARHPTARPSVTVGKLDGPRPTSGIGELAIGRDGTRGVSATLLFAVRILHFAFCRLPSAVGLD